LVTNVVREPEYSSFTEASIHFYTTKEANKFIIPTNYTGLILDFRSNGLLFEKVCYKNGLRDSRIKYVCQEDEPLSLSKKITSSYNENIFTKQTTVNYKKGVLEEFIIKGPKDHQLKITRVDCGDEFHLENELWIMGLVN
jgi:hypothetical protein